MLDPCGTAPKGDVEDYSITLSSKAPATWTGAVDNNWHNPGNWNSFYIPDATTDVIIPDVVNKCWVYAGTGYCNNITVEYGSGNDLRIWDQTLTIHGDADMYGQLLMDHVDGIITAEGDVNWHSGSRASIQANTVFWVHGDWNFWPGANVTMNNGYVDFTGSGSSFINSYEPDCYFNNIGVYKTGPDWLSISGTSTEDLFINGNIYIQPNANMDVFSSEAVVLQGDLYSAGNLYCYAGDFIFDGGYQTIEENLSYTTNCEFNNLVVSPTNNLVISYKYKTIKGNLIIESGYLSTNVNIYIEGNWDNQTGSPGLFGVSIVVFDGGNYHQYCSDEYFYFLEVDKPLGGAFRMQGTHVECDAYDWTAGAIDVIPGGGSFTAFDLLMMAFMVNII